MNDNRPRTTMAGIGSAPSVIEEPEDPAADSGSSPYCPATHERTSPEMDARREAVARQAGGPRRSGGRSWARLVAVIRGDSGNGFTAGARSSSRPRQKHPSRPSTTSWSASISSCGDRIDIGTNQARHRPGVCKTTCRSVVGQAGVYLTQARQTGGSARPLSSICGVVAAVREAASRGCPCSARRCPGRAPESRRCPCRVSARLSQPAVTSRRAPSSRSSPRR